ncbi:hypothetical protein LTR70_002834 [Exophiala xenobiotica]|uniref:SUR7 protein n=1 Tax=Lithohypha guttulata TaxID=1690604 RepID=A0ABR0KIZ2_9EURO|nr:hypothetical protein LTR24_002048 [Lithohypha guttulata]KAK5324550.1 hypothetical protein LTR70_002834 [Exophiala xenobiotica]
MVNAGRVASIFTPFALTIAALVCIILVFLGGSFDGNSTLDDLYFAKLDLTNFTTAVSANLAGGTTGSNLTVLGGALQAAKQQLDMKDYYTIYLRGYCGWNGDDTYANCSSPKAIFWFDPVTIWGLDSNTTGLPVEDLLPSNLRTGLSTYEKVSKAMSIVYLVALAATAATVLVGISAIFSRWGSLATTFFAAASGIFLLVGSIIATALFATLKTVLNKELEDEYGIHTSFGNKGYITTWAGTAFAVGAGFFWLLSVCCCTGRSPYNPGGKDARRTRAEKTPYTYERVGSPYLGPQGGQAVPLTNMGGGAQSAQRQTAYEPFRAQV